MHPDSFAELAIAKYNINQEVDDESFLHFSSLFASIQNLQTDLNLDITELFNFISGNLKQDNELFATVFVLDDIEPVYVSIANCINPAEAYKRVLDWFGQSADNIASIQLPNMQNLIAK